MDADGKHDLSMPTLQKKTWDGPQVPAETFYILQISSASLISKLQILVYSIYNYHSQSSLTINTLDI